MMQVLRTFQGADALHDCWLYAPAMLLPASAEAPAPPALVVSDHVAQAATPHSTRVRAGWLKIVDGRICAIHLMAQPTAQHHPSDLDPPLDHSSPPDQSLPAHRLETGLLAPGFVDVQINGCAGVLFNDAPTLDTLRVMAVNQRQFGTTALLPTVITDTPGVAQQAAAAVANALERQLCGIVGIHFEGPHLSASKGGCHPRQHLRPLTDADIALYCRRDLGTVMVTLAPEQVTAAHIRTLVQAGVIVSLGHSNASADEAQQAFAAGATGVTHLFNGMSGISSRAPGVAGAALANSAAYCGIIFDGEHLHPTAALMAYRAKGAAKLALVTDAMPPAGCINAVPFVIAGKPVSRDGMKLTDSAGSLAGSVLDMQSAVQYAIHTLGIPVADALQMASQTPADWLRRPDLGRIAVGARADLVWLA